MFDLMVLIDFFFYLSVMIQVVLFVACIILLVRKQLHRNSKTQQAAQLNDPVPLPKKQVSWTLK